MITDEEIDKAYDDAMLKLIKERDRLREALKDAEEMVQGILTELESPKPVVSLDFPRIRKILAVIREALAQ